MKPRVACLLLGASVLSAACAGGKPPFEFGIRPIALNLAFKEPKLAKPVEPRHIIRVIPAPPELSPQGLDNFRSEPGTPTPPPIVFPPATPDCPKASDGANPKEAVSFAVDRAPTKGDYPRHNNGSLTITGGAFPIALPFPPTSRWTIGKADSTSSTDPVGTTTTTFRYTVTKTLSPSFITKDTYEVQKDRVVLVERDTITDAGKTVFVPTPPIDFFVFGQEGDTWNSAGVDLDRGTSMVVQGAIEKREIVDVCGEVYDTFRVTSAETTVDLATGDTSGTPSDDPNVYNIATQFGGLVVREKVHQTVTTTDKASGSPLVVEFDYVSTLDSIEPEETS